MKKIKELNNKQKITVILVITVFIVSLFLLIKNISQVGKLNADITSLTIKDNKIILNVNSTKQKIMNKTQEANINIYSNNVELSKDEKISTGNILKYNNTNYEIAILGDPNKDGKVTGSDVSLIYAKYKGKVELTQIQALAADANNDGKITGSDVSYAHFLYKNPPEEIDENITYTINFDSNGGSNVSPITKDFGSEVGTLPEPSKEGYEFDGWYTYEGTKVNENTLLLNDTTYYAHYNVINYNITYTLNDGEATNPDTYNIESDTFTLNNPTKQGCIFKGWAGTDLEGTDNMNVTIEKGSIGDRAYQAIWEDEITYTVTFDSNGGSGVSPYVIKENEPIGTLITPIKAGHTFDGWYTSDNVKINTDTIVTGDITVYAHWTINSYTVTFDSNGGSAVANQTKTYGSTLGTLPTPTKQGATLDGWYTSSTGGSKISENTQVTNNVTYYAHWTYKDAIHFLNVGSSDAILIESQGRFGLIDASNPKNGSLGYNDATNNGTKVYNYLQKIGVTHLDFIIASHHHSDHIGGIPELVNSGSLVNSSTTYIYKSNFVDKNNAEVTEGVSTAWNNKGFYNLALSAMSGKGSKLYETGSHSAQNTLNISFVTNAESYKQYVTFSFGNYNIKIYNLYTNKYTFSGYTTTDENTNSLVTLITTNNSKKVLLMGDMNVRAGFEQKFADLIGKVDIYKATHHGYHYSNSKYLIDKINPSYVFIPNNLNVVNSRTGTSSSTIPSLTSSVSEFGAARLYLKQKGAKVYETGNSTDAYVVLFSGSNMSINNANGKSLSTSGVSEVTTNVNEGWHLWFYDNDTPRWYYIRNNAYLLGEQQISGKWYYFYNGQYGTAKNGMMAYNEYIGLPDSTKYWYGSDGAHTGETGIWKKDSGGWWFKYSDETYPKNTSLWIDGKEYYFRADGYCTNP